MTEPPLSERALALLRAGDAKRADVGLVFDDAAIPRLVALVRGLESDALVEAVHDLFRLAHFLDVERASPAASATLLTLVFEMMPALREVDAAAAAALSSQSEAAAAKLRQFSGDARVTTVLDTGARPADTTPAGPLARFQVLKK